MDQNELMEVVPRQVTTTIYSLLVALVVPIYLGCLWITSVFKSRFYYELIPYLPFLSIFYTMLYDNLCL